MAHQGDQASEQQQTAKRTGPAVNPARWLRYVVVTVTAVIVLHAIFAQGDGQDKLPSPIYHSTLRQALDRWRAAHGPSLCPAAAKHTAAGGPWQVTGGRRGGR